METGTVIESTAVPTSQLSLAGVLRIPAVRQVMSLIGVAGAGEEIKTRPFNLVVGRRWIGTAFGGVKGRTELPGMVDQYMDGTIELDSLVTHTMPLEEINTAFDLMHEGKSIKSVIMF